MKKSNPGQTEMPITSETELVEDRGEIPGYLKPKKKIQIAISGGVTVTEIERQIIDTPDFQRLRCIRELALAYLVYPTALHTRFDHALGTLFMATRMTQAIRDNPHSRPDERIIHNKQVALVRLYALVHDITHVPFSHTIEDEIKLFERHDQNEERLIRFLGPKSSIGKIIIQGFDDSFLEKLLNIYRWDGDPKKRKFPSEEVFIYDLVSNTVCADLLDYLQRDNYFCNLGVKLVYHFIDFLYLSRDEHGQKRVFVRLWKSDDNGGRPRRDTLTDLCRLLETRYIVAERVYFHHAKIAASAMLGRAIQEAQIDGEINEKIMWDMTDEGLLARLRKSKNDLVSRLATEVSNRQLYKEHHTFSWADVQNPQSQDHLTNQYDDIIQVRVGDSEKRRGFENQIADIIRADPGDVLIYAPTRKMNRKEAEMKVLWEGHPTELKEIDDPVVRPRLKATLDAHKLLWSIRLLVRRSLTREQQQWAKELCEIELLSVSRERVVKEQAIYRQVVERVLVTENRVISKSAQEYDKQIGKIVQGLIAVAHEGQNFDTRLSELIELHFPNP